MWDTIDLVMSHALSIKKERLLVKWILWLKCLCQDKMFWIFLSIYQILYINTDDKKVIQPNDFVTQSIEYW